MDAGWVLLSTTIAVIAVAVLIFKAGRWASAADSDQARFRDFRQEMRGEFRAFRTEMRDEFRASRTEMRGE